MNFNDLYNFVVERKLAKIKELQDKKKLEQFLLKCLNPKEVIEKLSAFDLSELSIDVYKRKIPGYYNLYDYILKNKKNTSFLAKNSDNNNPDIFIPWILNKKSVSYLDITDELLMTNTPDGTKIIEYLIDNNIKLDKFTINNLELAKIIYQKNKLEYLSVCSPILYDKELSEGKTIFDILIANKILPSNRGVGDSNYNYFDFDLLLKEINGKTILEHLIDNNFKFQINGNYDSNYNNQILKVITILLKKNKFELLKEYCDTSFLKLKITDENNVEHTVLDYYVASKGKIPKLFFYDNLDPDFITHYINLANKTNEKEIAFDSISGVLKNVNDLLVKGSDGLTNLEVLVSNYADYMYIIKILKKFDYIPEEVTLLLAKMKFPLPSFNYKSNFGFEKNDDVLEYIYKEDEITIDDSEFTELINNFYATFNDNNSSKEVLDLVVSSSKKSYTIDKYIAMRDIEALIEMKKRYPDFIIKYDSTKGSFFRRPNMQNKESCISIQNIKDIGALNHEWGHLIHFLKNNSKVPRDANDLIKVQIHNVYKYWKEIDIRFHEVVDLADKLLLSDEDVEKAFLKYINLEKGGMDAYQAEIKREFQEFYGTKEMLLSTIKNYFDYSKDVYLALASAYFDYDYEVDKEKVIEMYVQNRIEIDKKYFIKNIYEKNNQDFLMYENFLDAYYLGSIGERFKRSDIDSKVPTCVHDQEYFINVSNPSNLQFSEMFANYVALRKSKNGIKYIELLKQETSLELIEYLEEYYRNLSFKEELKR